MLEIPGLTALSLAILVYLKLLAGDPDPREYMLLGAAITLTYLVRTPYGIILLIAVAVNLVLEVRGRVWRLWNARTFYLLLPLVLVLAVWFAYPPKLASTWSWLVNYPDGVDEPYGAEGWLFYPLALVRIVGSPWLFALYLAGMVYALVERRQKPGGAIFLVLLVLVQVLIGEFHQNKQARYMFPVLPAWFLLAGNLLMGLGQRLAARRPQTARWAGVVVALLLVVQGGVLLRDALATNRPTPPDGVSAYVAQVAGQAQQTLVIGSMDMTYPSPPLLDWRLTTEQGLLAAPWAGSAVQIEEGRKLAGLAAALPLPAGVADALQQAMVGYDQPAALRTLYLGLPIRASYSEPAQAPGFVADLLERQGIDQVVVITASRPGVRYPLETLAPGLAAAGLERVDGAAFPDVAMQVDVFRR
jgi:4-amino-4-deoxy-L-arabinose transferase-like glycosyltransferase